MYLNQSQASSIMNTSSSLIHNSQEHLISKILELEARLYRVSIDNQELRLKKNGLEIDYSQKKALLLQSQHLPKPSLKRHAHNYSQSTISYSQQVQTETPVSGKCSAFASVRPRKIEPITGLEGNFEVLRQVMNQGSQIENSMRGLSSPRTTGIRKNLVSPRGEQGAIGFKSIQEIWNGTRNSETFLKKKGPEKSSYAKKKSYLS